MKMKKLALFLIMLLCTATLAQDLPRIAVYVTGDVPDNEKKALGTRMLSALINSGRYMGIERSNSFLAEVEKEQVKQRSGAIDDNQISELGKQFGVRFVCIADITPAFGSYQVSARIVDVETAVVVSIGESFSPLKTANDLRQVSNDVVMIMFRSQDRAKPKSEPKPELERKAEPKPEPKPEPEQKAESKPEPKPKPEPKLEPKPEPEKKPVASAPKRAAPSPKPVTLPECFKKTSFWIGVGLDVLGAGIIAYGLIENENAIDHAKRYQYSKAENTVIIRNIAYTVGAAALLGGISVHIFF